MKNLIEEWARENKAQGNSRKEDKTFRRKELGTGMRGEGVRTFLSVTLSSIERGRKGRKARASEAQRKRVGKREALTT